MACKTSFELYHNFPKLAEESGFTFNTHRPRVHIEWNKIRLVDIESLIRERKFILIEQHVNDILDCVLESEFDVRILDEGVLKIFRLAQLAVEYQQFCRHYLDRSVYVLREEVSAIAQELDSTKRLLKEKEDEIRKLRRKSKHSFRTPLPYGNDNIATMILKTLNNKADIFPTLASTDTLQQNKCIYCDKVFLNQLYLQSHLSRRHANVTELPQKDLENNQFEVRRDENDKLTNEITELRSKLTDMEKLIENFRNKNIPQIEDNTNNKNQNKSSCSKEMKDAEVSANGEGYILDRIEEWKKEEHEKYNQEINLLRSQIIAMIDFCKENEKQTPIKDDSMKNIAELHTIISQQGAEISALKQELTKSKSTPDAEDIEQRKKIEAQMTYWVNRAELQSNEYKLLLQKLDEVAKEAEMSRAQADAERAHVSKLEELLLQNNEKISPAAQVTRDVIEPANKENRPPEENTTTETTERKSKPKINSLRERSVSLQKLQQKAQELLNIENITTSDNSVSSEEKIRKDKKVKIIQTQEKYEKNHSNIKENRKKRQIKAALRNSDDLYGGKKETKSVMLQNVRNKVRSKEALQSNKENGSIIHPGSPVKIIRAKITEEVNNRLVALGVDPLKSRIPQNVFIKQKMQLQEQQELKFKKRPESEQVLHSLLARLDTHAAILKKENAQSDMQSNSPTKHSKGFSLSTVISNVKSKALSLVKTNDSYKNAHKSYDNVAKRAMLLLGTPPSSNNSSPKIQNGNNSPDVYKDQQSTKATGSKITRDRSVFTESYAINARDNESDTESILSNHENHNQASITIDNLVKSPSWRPMDVKNPKSSLNGDEQRVITKPNSETGDNNNKKYLTENSSDDVDSLVDHTPRRTFSVDNIASKQTKGVLKHASSTSSLNKKKVIFDMDAIQMKSVSASSPSQSVTEKSDNNVKYGLGVINLNNEEWDISSIENEPVQNNPVTSRTSPKIAELKQTIESQLTRRNNTMSTALVGGVDVLAGPALKKSAVSGSNTSLGSSILDDTDSMPAQNQIAFVKPRSFIEKDDSEIDISEFMTDDLIKNSIKTK